MQHTLSTIRTRLISNGLADNLSDNNMKIAYIEEVKVLLLKTKPEIENNNGYPENFLVDQAFKLSIIDDLSHAFLSSEKPLDARATRQCLRAQRTQELGVEVY